MSAAIWEGYLSLGLTGGSLVSIAAAMRLDAADVWRRDLVAYELRFPRGLDEQAVITFVSGLSGLVPSKWRRLVSTNAVVFETRAKQSQITHYLIMPERLSGVVLGQLRAALPGVRTVRVDVPKMPTLRVATQLDLSNREGTLGDGREAASAAIIAALGGVRAGETAIVQWILNPTPPAALPPEILAGQRAIDRPIVDVLRGRPLTPDERRAYLEKHRSATFIVAGRVGVAAVPERASNLMVALLSSFHHLNAPGVHLKQSRMAGDAAARGLTERRPPLFRALPTLNSEEISGLVGWPLGIDSAPGLELGATKQLPPHPSIARVGRVIGEATYSGAERPIALSLTDSLRHTHLIGPTGSGKSTLMINLIAQDMRSGAGVFVVDPKGDLIDDVLDRVPPERVDDVVVLDPLDGTPVGINLLERPGATPELIVDQVVGVFADIFRQSWGVRSEDILRGSLASLVGVPGMTLVEVPLLLTDEGFRRRIVTRTDDFVLQQFWSWYESLSAAERAQIIAPLLNKLRAVLLRPQLRAVFGQAAPAFDMDEALAKRRIILVPLSKGLLGDEAAALTGSLITTRFWQAITARVALPADRRPITMAYWDEFQEAVRSATDLEAMLALGRGLGVGLHLAHQNLDQLPQALRKTVMANARSRVMFQTSAADARVLAKELAPHLTADDLRGLGAYEIVATLSAGGQVAPPVTARTLPSSPTTGMAEAAKAASRARYGRDRAQIEAEIRRRHGYGDEAEGRVGRREVRP